MSYGIKRFAKHTSIYAIGNLINRIGAFILLPLYTTHLTLSEYGILELFYSTSSVVNSLLGLGLGHATLRFYFEYDSERDRKRVVSTSLLASMLITTAGVSLLSIWNEELSLLLFKTPDYSNAFYALYAILVLEISTRICFAYIRAKEYSIFFVYINSIRLIIQVGFNYYAVAVLNLKVTAILMGNLCAVLISWLFLLYKTVKENGIGFDREKFKEIFNYSYPFYGSSIAQVLLKNADRFLLMSFSSLSAVGAYSLAMKFAQIPLELFHEPFKRSYGSFRFAIMKEKNAEELQIKLTRYMLLGMASISVVMAIFSIDVLKIMSSKEFYDAANYIPILLLAVCIASLSYPFQTGIMVTKKTGYAFWISFAKGISALALNLVLIPIYDAYGASVSFLLSVGLSMCLTCFISQKLLRVGYEFRKFIYIITAGAVVYLLSLFSMKIYHLTNIVGYSLFKSSLFFLFLLLILLTNCIMKAEVILIKEFVRDKAKHLLKKKDLRKA